MNIEQYLTSETYKAWAGEDFGPEFDEKIQAFCRGLERRIAVCREALKQIQHNSGNMDMEVGFLSGHIAKSALELTKP